MIYCNDLALDVFGEPIHSHFGSPIEVETHSLTACVIKSTWAGKNEYGGKYRWAAWRLQVCADVEKHCRAFIAFIAFMHLLPWHRPDDIIVTDGAEEHVAMTFSPFVVALPAMYGAAKLHLQVKQES